MARGLVLKEGAAERALMTNHRGPRDTRTALCAPAVELGGRQPKGERAPVVENQEMVS